MTESAHLGIVSVSGNMLLLAPPAKMTASTSGMLWSDAMRAGAPLAVSLALHKANSSLSRATLDPRCQ